MRDRHLAISEHRAIGRDYLELVLYRCGRCIVRLIQFATATASSLKPEKRNISRILRFKFYRIESCRTRITGKQMSELVNDGRRGNAVISIQVQLDRFSLGICPWDERRRN